jgi:hypothetical protein
MLMLDERLVEVGGVEHLRDESPRRLLGDGLTPVLEVAGAVADPGGKHFEIPLQVRILPGVSIAQQIRSQSLNECRELIATRDALHLLGNVAHVTASPRPDRSLPNRS